jgi:hypothetical protein
MRGVNHPPSSTAEVKERIQIYLWAFMACSGDYYCCCNCCCYYYYYYYY